ncbi:MAG: hypothetical protein IK103_00490 [Bacteroidales bacterium]|nr:hypothetical protein [Bacteroidales bacterium]
MKNLFLAAGLLLALLFANDVKAQVIGKDIKTNNEFSLTYGTLSNSEWIEAFGEVVTVMFGGDTKTKTAFGPMSAEYFRRITPVVAVGAIGSVSSFREDMMKRTTTTSGETTSEKIGDYTRSYFSFMPAAKFNWLRKEHFGMYSKVAAGVTFTNTNMKDTDPTVATKKDNNVMFNFQASLIGIEAGGQLRGFAEFGMGEQGAILLGIRYNF